MADGTGLLKDNLASNHVPLPASSGRSTRIQHQAKAVQCVLLFFIGRGLNLSPALLHTARQCGILERHHLPQLIEAELTLGDPSCIHGVQQCHRPNGPTAKRVTRPLAQYGVHSRI